jgi:hypothetical protein
MKYPSAFQIFSELTDALIDRCDVNIDDFVYDIISSHDQYFEGDSDWFDEEDTDMKDILRDQVLLMIDFNSRD